MVDVVLPDIRMTVGIVVGVATCVIMRVRVCAGWIVPGNSRMAGVLIDISLSWSLGTESGVVEESAGVLSLAVW